MTSHLTGALAAIIAEPDCCAASKAIARAALSEEAQRISDAEASLDEIVQIAQAAGDYGVSVMRGVTPAPSPTPHPMPTMRFCLKGLFDE